MCSPVGSHGEGHLHGHQVLRQRGATVLMGLVLRWGLGFLVETLWCLYYVLYGTNASLQQLPSREHE